MFSLRFLVSKLLINLRWQFHARTFFVYVKFLLHNSLRDLQYFHFVFKTTICAKLQKCANYVLGCFFIKTCSVAGR